MLCVKTKNIAGGKRGMKDWVNLYDKERIFVFLYSLPNIMSVIREKRMRSTIREASREKPTWET
jgi:hypothetical protein